MKESKYSYMFLFLKYITFFLIFLILNYSKINNIAPFAFGMFFCLVWCNQKILIVGPLYILASVIADFSLFSILQSVITVLIMYLAYFCHYRFKKPINLILLTLYSMLSCIINLFVANYMSKDILIGIVGCFLGVVAMFAYIHFFQNIILHGLRRKFQSTEAMSGGILLLLLINGFFNLPLVGEYIVFGLVAFIVLVGLYCFGAGVALYLSVISGIGMAFATNSLMYVALFSVWAMVASGLFSNNRFYSAVGLFFVDVIMQFYFFPTYNYIKFISTLLGCIAYVLLPKRIFNILSNIIIDDRENNAALNLLNKERANLYQRLKNLSLVFREMKNAFYNMTNNSISKDEIKFSLSGDIKRNICNHCSNKSTCLRTFEEETNKAFLDISNFAIERGKVNIIDIPVCLSCRCTRLGGVINEVNKGVVNYKDRQMIVDNSNINKSIIAEQLFAVSEVMSELAESVASNVIFDTAKEHDLMELLSYNHILCIDSVVYLDRRKNYYVSLLIRENDFDKDKIINIVANTLNQPMQILKKSKSKKKGFCLIDMKIANTFDVVFGCSGTKKINSTESGDTYSVIRIGVDKYLLALCDGMGSGEKAERNSTLAINLIENFYKAGFDTDVILRIVNKLLIQNGEDDFNALDIGVIDLLDGGVDLYKVGSPCGFLKRRDTTEIINSGALPLGILDDIKPGVFAKILGNGDMIIFLTDGIYDAFGDEIELRNFIDFCNTTNPQILADEILNKSIELNNMAPKDDMTVLVGKIYKI